MGAGAVVTPCFYATAPSLRHSLPVELPFQHHLVSGKAQKQGQRFGIWKGEGRQGHLEGKGWGLPPAEGSCLGPADVERCMFLWEKEAAADGGSLKTV